MPVERYTSIQQNPSMRFWKERSRASFILSALNTFLAISVRLPFAGTTGFLWRRSETDCQRSWCKPGQCWSSSKTFCNMLSAHSYEELFGAELLNRSLFIVDRTVLFWVSPPEITPDPPPNGGSLTGLRLCQLAIVPQNGSAVFLLRSLYWSPWCLH